MTNEQINKNVPGNLTPDDIINGGLWKCSRDFSDKEHYELILEIGRSGILKDILDKKQIENLARYFVSLRFGPTSLLYWIVSDPSYPGENLLSLRSVNLDGNTFSPKTHLYYLYHVDSEAKELEQLYIFRAFKSIGAKFKPDCDRTFSNLL